MRGWESEISNLPETEIWNHTMVPGLPGEQLSLGFLCLCSMEILRKYLGTWPKHHLQDGLPKSEGRTASRKWRNAVYITNCFGNGPLGLGFAKRENSMERGATVHREAKNGTWLKWLSTCQTLFQKETWKKPRLTKSFGFSLDSGYSESFFLCIFGARVSWPVCE